MQKLYVLTWTVLSVRTKVSMNWLPFAVQVKQLLLGQPGESHIF